MSNEKRSMFKNTKREVLLNKAIQSGEASNFQFITLPSGTTAQLDALDRNPGAIYYNSEDQSLVIDNGSSVDPIGGDVSSVNGEVGAVQLDAVDIPYDNTDSGLSATDVQEAIDEIVAELPASGANTGLSNLTSPTAINQNLLPDITQTKFIGSSSLEWAVVHSVNYESSSGMGITATGSNINITGAGLTSEGNIRFLSPDGVEAPSIGFTDAQEDFVVAVKAPDALSESYVLTLPDADGNSGDVLQTDGSGNLSFVAPAGVPAGGPNQIGYYDGSSSFGSNANLTFDDTTSSLVMGVSASGGIVESPGVASMASGHADLGSIIRATLTGSRAHGRATNGGTIEAAGIGSNAGGYGDGVGSITTLGVGSHAFGCVVSDGIIVTNSDGGFSHGYAEDSAVITSTAIGATAFGCANDAGSVVSSSGLGSFSTGRVESVGVIEANSVGGFAGGVARTDGRIETTGEASLAYGRSEDATSLISAQGPGSLAIGEVESAGQIISAGTGSHAQGSAEASDSIQANGTGSTAKGFAQDGSIIATGDGSAAFGVTNASFPGSLQAAGTASFVSGVRSSVGGDYAAAFGIGHDNSSFASFFVGRFSPDNFTFDSWINTDPLFMAGNGADSSNRASAYRLDKDGKITTTAAQRHTACREVSADTTLSARTDRTLFVDTASAAGNVTITFPPGEDGLEFFIKDSGANANVNNILFVADGTDGFEISGDSITNVQAVRHLQFFDGIWYIMNVPL